MVRYLIAASAVALFASAAPAQTQAGSHNPVIKDGAPHGVAAPAKGANSFTEDQA
ncbi:hypothetical protein QE452_003790, partial [Sphingomonas sp. SORGH_AS438]|nr:hypothetical protein [Sphingomonas sp. SORGH_AS_0438]